jgi:hypothetical protein
MNEQEAGTGTQTQARATEEGGPERQDRGRGLLERVAADKREGT